ncbi:MULTISPECIES: type II toxin-antitoxin system RelE/ParE family toxin [unclassified Halomonas]|uniref:type II toxin-antitoxin system RelE family toxin n=1 Tax=unclassified Halomonas TaxID=2609666 RepID=UPI0007D8FCA0|nr:MULTISPECIES: type II toxin-antitoxin system RelE/ParE family toxin [unclassified Halomonas]MBT2788462.1 type II toxin-antitoxin system RelE/ParE family toxin [Halomonas sp. ISL-106]MBT2798053.1 type II toxin-antitoxin system RelE/ParE family toxin [Halomonas sp. ISL-104]OAL60618.1 plasmid stabilization protein [Halomonas sp. ALS9]
MAWQVIYHPDVQRDLTRLGAAAANRILDVIEERIRDGEPGKLGKPLRGALAGCRRMRTGNIRIVYKVDGDAIQVLIITVGARRVEEVNKIANQRVK